MSVLEQRIPKGSKQTDIGVIPDDWDLVYLNNIAEKIMVGIASAATHAYRDRGIPFLRNQNILPNKLDEKDTLFISPEYEVIFQNKRLKTGDLLTARTGYPGTTCMVPDKYNGAQSFTTLITRLKKSISDPRYVSAYMNSEAGKKFFELNQIGGGQKNVNSSILKTFPIAFPSVEEQNAIANVLSDADELLTELERLIAKKQAIKTATMQQLLTGQTRLPQFAMREDGSPKILKQSELGKIPEDWTIKNISEFTDCTAGGTPSTTTPAYWGGSIPWMSSGELHLKRVFDVAERITDLGLANSSTKYIPEESILIGLAGQGKTRGTVAISKIKLCTNQSIAAIFPSKDHSTDYLFYNLDSRYEELRGLSTGDGGRGGLNLTIIRRLKVPYPTLEEQKAIANILSDMDTEIQILEQRLAKTRQIKQGMMQELLTGRTRLPYDKE